MNPPISLSYSSFRIYKRNEFPGIFLFFLMLITSLSSSGQKPTDPASKLSIISVDSTRIKIEEKLVALAMKSPSVKISEHQAKINEFQLKGARDAWMNVLSLSANYNDQTFAKTPAGTNAYVYPKYFFGINIPLGTLFSRTAVKSARESVEITKNTQEQLARDIRQNVISKYRQYLTASEIIANQAEIVDDYQAAYLQAKNKFSQGTITIEVHNIASKNYNDEYTRLINLQLQLSIIKLEIENMIGTSLDSVINNPEITK